MNLTVHKYVWPPTDGSPITEIAMPRHAEILHVGNQKENVCIWARVDTDKPMEWRKFAMVATGAPCPPNRYVGTVILRGGALVLHVFEENLGRQLMENL